MSMLSIHLYIVHFTIVGVVLSVCLLFYAVVFQKKEVIKAALILLSLMSFSVIISANTGEGAEHDKEALVEGSACEKLIHHLIHEHEEVGEQAVLLLLFNGVLSLLVFFAYTKAHRWTNALMMCLLLVALSSCVLLCYLGRLGGQISHDQLYPKGKNCIEFKD